MEEGSNVAASVALCFSQSLVQVSLYTSFFNIDKCLKLYKLT